MIKREDIIKKAREYLNTPWKHQGRSKITGVDCVGLFVCVLKELGLPVIDRTDYRDKPKPDELIDAIENHCAEIPIIFAKPGDLLLFWVRRPWLPQHIGLLTDYGFIHTPLKAKVVEYELGNWENKIYSAYSFKGVI
jgi:cell wall-associated NlpC family hydrolase